MLKFFADKTIIVGGARGRILGSLTALQKKEIMKS